MRLTLGPLQYFWPRERVLAFYHDAATWPVDVIYVGETVCSKRRELRTQDWIALAEELAGSGREVVLSTLALIEAESDLSSLTRLVDERTVPHRGERHVGSAAAARARRAFHRRAEL